MNQNAKSYVDQYLSRTNPKMLFLLLAHFPINLGIAYAFDTGLALALILTSMVVAGPLLLTLTRAKPILTSASISIALLCMSALDIHLARGMIEMHFHVFVSLALLIVFGNAWMLVLGAATIAVHHVSFFFLLPKSVFNYEASLGIVLIHAVFVVVETIPAAFISHTFGRFIRAQGTIVSELAGVVDQIEKISGTVTNNSAHLASDLNKQTTSIQSTVTSVGQVSAMAKKASESAQSAVLTAETSGEVAQKGKQSIDSLLDANSSISQLMRDIVKQNSESYEQISEIVKLVTEIDNKTKVINDIVFQTKLLSFNASVEAARAGEAGKGFAVVAEEVGGLAQLSGTSAKDITDTLNKSVEKINHIINDSKNKMNALIEMGSKRVQSSEAMSQDCMKRFEEIIGQVDSLSSVIHDIAETSKRQTEDLAQVNAAVSEIEAFSSTGKTKAEETATVASAMSESASRLKHEVSQLMSLVGSS